MKHPSLLPVFLSFLILLNPSHILGAKSSNIPLDPKQLRALQSLNFPTSNDPCSNPPPLHNATLCDNAKPFRHLISLHLTDCSDDVSLSFTALKSLPTLQELSFINCPQILINRFPTDVASKLQSFTFINGLHMLDGIMISRLERVTDLTISSVAINASEPSVILDDLRILKKLTITHANLTGFLPKSWHPSITHIDLSYNQLKGKIHSALTELENLVSLNLTSNQLTGELPTSIGDLIGLKNLLLSSNSLSGSIPESMASMPYLEYIDLSSNQLNGSIPKFLNKLKNLKYLSLEKNNFQGVMPFNWTFIKKLEFFKIGDNVDLCYNKSSIISPKIKLGIASCDKNGRPVLPTAKAVPSGDDEDDYSGDEDEVSQDETSHKSSVHHGPNKAVVGIAIALSFVVFLIIFLIWLSRKYAC